MVLLPALDLLTSQGGTEAVAPALGILVLLAAVLGGYVRIPASCA